MSAQILRFPVRERPRRTPDMQPHPSRGRSFYSFALITADLLSAGAITADMAFRNIQKFLNEQGGDDAQN